MLPIAGHIVAEGEKKKSTEEVSTVLSLSRMSSQKMDRVGLVTVFLFTKITHLVKCFQNRRKIIIFDCFFIIFLSLLII